MYLLLTTAELANIQYNYGTTQSRAAESCYFFNAVFNPYCGIKVLNMYQ